MDHAAFECVRCGVHLPLQRDLAADDPQTWVCANCGWQMPGEHDPGARESIQANAFLLGSQIESYIVDLRRDEDTSEFEPLLRQLLGRLF